MVVCGRTDDPTLQFSHKELSHRKTENPGMYEKIDQNSRSYELSSSIVDKLIGFDWEVENRYPNRASFYLISSVGSILQETLAFSIRLWQQLISFGGARAILTHGITFLLGMIISVVTHAAIYHHLY
eukprot:GHVH01007299.1.p1 GENE.GHVH01007299.1~~GHVH01007299.1.p1  ORF type:complete len:127 (+),score=13.82 GHVH01007299.1:552-932(+)